MYELTLKYTKQNYLTGNLDVLAINTKNVKTASHHNKHCGFILHWNLIINSINLQQKRRHEKIKKQIPITYMNKQ